MKEHPFDISLHIGYSFPNLRSRPMTDLITELEAATEGSRELDEVVALAFGWRFCDKTLTHKGVDRCWFEPDNTPYISVCPPTFTTSLDAALTLVPSTATNFHLFSFIGHGVDEFGKTAWGFGFMDTAQLVGEHAAKKEIERMKRDVGWGDFAGPPLVKMEKAIAEHFIEFNCPCAATRALAVCVAALKARVIDVTGEVGKIPN
jgi:hypothetical protein